MQSTEPPPFPFASSFAVREFPPEYADLPPVSKVLMPGGLPAWLVTGYDDVRRVLTDPVFSRAAASTPEVGQVMSLKVAGASLIGLDPPEHTRLRRLVSGAFTPRRIESLRPRIDAIAGELLAAVRDAPQPVDLMPAFCGPLPIRVIAELLGVPGDDHAVFWSWSRAALSLVDEDGTEEADAAYDRLDGYIRGLIADKRARPDERLISALIAARDEEDRLSEDEMVGLCVLMVVAGYETTGSQLSTLLTVLLTDPEARDLATGASLPALIEEVLRRQNISTIGGAQPRVALADVELGGVAISAGEAVMPAPAAANMDPDVYAEPDRIDLRHRNRPHMAFGAGIHHCLGAGLARAELHVAVDRLFREYPRLTLAVPPDELRLVPGSIIRSLQTLPVRW